ncbi:MAG: UPF0262 family protein [Alphaproteobacteria bacterium]|nr:UPF0262 family protein [Alphaproteobacteria bacterium]
MTGTRDRQQSIRSVSIVETSLLPSAQSLIHRDREIALRDLEASSVFEPCGDFSRGGSGGTAGGGPYDLTLSVEDGRLVFRTLTASGEALPILVLSLKPYRRLIKDYFLIVRSYDEAMREGKPSRIEAIDMGRRGLHNEGAGLLIERLEDKITMDLDTARRLFTLICVLHGGITALR